MAKALPNRGKKVSITRHKVFGGEWATI